MAVTTKKIAELAGVSRGTVDRVLNDRGGVKEETRRRVQGIARQLGYVPNRAGKALSSGRRPLKIGLVLNCEDIPFYDEVIRGIESCRAAYPDFNISLVYRRLKGYEPAEQITAINACVEERVQLLVITPINEPRVVLAINAVCEGGTPVITLNNDVEGSRRMLHVGCNYYASGRTAAGMTGLITGGRGCAGVVVGSLQMLGHRRRMEGFRDTLEGDFPGMRCLWVVENGDDDHLSYSLLKKHMRETPDIEAVYFASAGNVGGVRAIAEARGDDMPVVITCDDIPQTREMVHSGQVRATICQEPFRQGYEAMRLALEYWITGRRPAAEILYVNNEIKIVQNID